MVDYRGHQYFLYSVVIFMTFLGLFGNLNLILLHVRRPILRNKYGCLLTLLTTFQTYCVLSESVNVAFGIATMTSSYQIKRDFCYNFIFPDIFCNCVQTILITALSIDFLFCILFPIRHRNLSNGPYLSMILSIALIYASYIIILGYVGTDDAIIKLCNPPTALPPQVATLWYRVAFIAALATSFAYVMSFSLIYFKAKAKTRPTTMQVEKKAMRSISVLLIVFILTRVSTTLIINFLRFINSSQEIITLVQDYNVIFAMLLYSQNAYVCFIRSAEYRRMFLEQILPMTSCFCPCWSENIKTYTTNNSRPVLKPVLRYWNR
ncbi:unnamed protein product [Caenorhabditis auriculariae]|uniref:G-protein coupled receptors family 1 profile domain-containing protein n=1 Tax=Caenorhabditis auriculariae TaxID=2777116 RepID=A0A8S1HH10_9PELO|nr:unnamed protein product [Caenorhabditis auriculariae]